MTSTETQPITAAAAAVAAAIAAHGVTLIAHNFRRHCLRQAQATPHWDADLGKAWQQAADNLAPLLYELIARDAAAPPAAPPIGAPAPAVELVTGSFLGAYKRIGWEVDGDPLDEHVPFDDIAAMLELLATITRLQRRRFDASNAGDHATAHALGAAIDALRNTLPEVARW